MADPVEANFAVYIKRSQEAARVAQRRPNALLMVGTSVAIIGLVFFVATLPGSRFAQTLLGEIGTAAERPIPTVAPSATPSPVRESPSPDASVNQTPSVASSTPQSNLPADNSIWISAIQLLPRLLMLIFIQLLARFFLRQYRSSVEDFRYYESILRHREAQYLSYTLRLRLNDNKSLSKFADELLKPESFGVLVSGQTTAALEAQRSEKNEFGTLYDKLANHISRTIKQENAGKEKDRVKTSDKPSD